MRPPSTFQWLIGNPVVGCLLSVLALASLAGWFTGDVPGLLTLLAIWIGAMAGRAMERVNAYTRWQREWSGMGGGGGGMRLPSLKALRILAALIVWLIFAVWSLEAPADDPWMQTAAVLFWIGTAVMGFAAVARALGLRAPHRRDKVTAKVSVCVCRPVHSPSLRAIYENVGAISRIGQELHHRSPHKHPTSP
ncbi:MAG: hypothetical protein JHC96_04590 [Brevundimonas sp.]|jgi:hypothetical protein|uniref:hypothetical protein n=1 Tax=Brevundimonas sp. TaxID=1871086 RepID=UPI001A23B442|nr:hypothetical protein [Brevundimonas sp.]MBJ7318059.1 hypothetical protein [Brevundimonas sp.]